MENVLREVIEAEAVEKLAKQEKHTESSRNK